ncbi:hypothetical protein BGW80DRAFT_1294414, partial [Lactifluus volemus]
MASQDRSHGVMAQQAPSHSMTRKDVLSLCGPGPPWGDKELSERRGGEADHQCKCNFFKWVNDDKHELERGTSLYQVVASLSHL